MLRQCKDMDLFISDIEQDGDIYWMRVNHRFEIRFEKRKDHLYITAMPVYEEDEPHSVMVLPDADFPPVNPAEAIDW